MTDQNRVLPKDNPDRSMPSGPTKVRNICGLWIAGIVLVVTTATAGAQTASSDSVRVDKLNVVRTRTPFNIGATMALPTRIRANDPRKLQISCKVVCSPFEPRQSLTQIAWPEQPGAKSLNLQTLRLDIIGAPAKFNKGNYGTVRIRTIPRVKARPGAGIDLEAVRKQTQPALIQRIENNRVMARDLALPAPEAIKKERLPQVRKKLRQETRAALERDAKLGAYGRMQAIAQTIELKRSIPHRSLVLEGMQPGLTYKIRLVQDRAAAAADSLAEDICRIPVCPADFIDMP